VDKNGVININKLNEDIKRDDIPKAKALQIELDNLSNRYVLLKEEFDLINLSNKELKYIYHEKNNGNKKNQNENNNISGLSDSELKIENRELEKKIEIMAERLTTLSDENKEYESKIEKLKMELKHSKSRARKSTSLDNDNVFEDLPIGVPGIPSIPGVPGVPSIPGIPGVPGVKIYLIFLIYNRYQEFQEYQAYQE
jgi:cell division protein FtsB